MLRAEGEVKERRGWLRQGGEREAHQRWFRTGRDDKSESRRASKSQGQYE